MPRTSVTTGGGKLRPLKLEGGVKVADGAYLLEERRDLKHCRFRQPGGDDLHAYWRTVVACSEPHRQGRHAGQAEGRSRTLHMERRNRLAIDDEITESMFGRRERSDRTEQRIVTLEIVNEAVAETLHHLFSGDEVGYRRVR